MKGHCVQSRVLSSSQNRLESGVKSGRLAGEEVSMGTLASGLVSVGVDVVRPVNALCFGRGTGEVAAGRTA